MKVLDVLQKAIECGASDVFLIPGVPVTYKVNGTQQRMDAPKLTPADTSTFVQEIYQICERDTTHLEETLFDDDFSFALWNLGRFRVNVLHQRGSLAAVIRVIQFGIPSPEKMNIPDEVMTLANERNGLVLVTGSAGSGKSTTLACIMDRINETRDGHIITMEDPIEYVHAHKKSIVTQREVFTDCASYISALRSALRECPDVILLGEMRDKETIETAMTAAETGQLLFSTLHTTGAANVVNRIVDVFPAQQQDQIRVQLSMILRAVVSQQLVPAVDGTMIPVFEIMRTNPAIRNLIRENKTYQLDAAIQAGAAEGMCTMDNSLLALYKAGRITKETALAHSLNYEAMQRKLAW